ncbi:hypothetical protein CQW39_32230 [Streptomyces griseofuscus]|uniref:Uncharacterized protein n=1 Tax=Streptomyces griseofuscus TaxID=146922 RepID=A0A426S9D4_9ACTN|nr:hypothetical protein CQW39_32230 [Streptomyces griseofuscus]RRQ86789.1 hypothetical protein CQW44_13330 [Streptomyces griseofuscus]
MTARRAPVSGARQEMWRGPSDVTVDVGHAALARTAVTGPSQLSPVGGFASGHSRGVVGQEVCLQ